MSKHKMQFADQVDECVRELDPESRAAIRGIVQDIQDRTAHIRNFGEKSALELIGKLVIHGYPDKQTLKKNLARKEMMGKMACWAKDKKEMRHGRKLQYGWKEFAADPQGIRKDPEGG